MANRARPRIAINDEDGRPVGAADIEVVNPSEARASLHVESGHLPVGSRQRLVDAVLDAPEISSRQHVQVASVVLRVLVNRQGIGATSS